MILIAIIPCPAVAHEARNCDPRAGLVDGSCYVPRSVPWWKCEDNTQLTLRQREVTSAQQQRLEKLSLTLFASTVPDYRPDAPGVSRGDIVALFGQPGSTESETLPLDPLGDPSDTQRWISTTWKFPGLKITTIGPQTSPDRFWVESGEISGAKVSLPYGVRVGQPIDRWKREFGQPNCIDGRPTYESHFPYGEELWFFGPALYRIVLFVDKAGKVRRISWDHPPTH
jgi:hypothetical protein